MSETLTVSVNMDELMGATDQIMVVMREMEIAKACGGDRMASIFADWQNRLQAVLNTITIDTSGVSDP